MGTPDFAVAALNALVAAGHDIVRVYTQPPRPAGRGRKNRPTPVHRQAGELGLTVRHPINLGTPEFRTEFAALDADAAVVVAYGSILPQPILDAPANGCLNIHASLLPRWRGAAPIQRAIMSGDRTTGICIVRMDAGLDTGPVLLTCETPIGTDETAGQLHDRLALMGGKAIVDALEKLDTLRPREQPATGATYAKKISKAEARIVWTESAPAVDRKIRGLSPSPGAWCEYEGQRIGVLASRCVEASFASTPGQVLDDRLTVACGDGAVRLLRLQRAGKNALDAKTFLRGLLVPVNARLG